MAKDIKQLKVSAIRNGTVIDHIPANNLFKVITILGLDHIENQITFGTNLESKRLGIKAIVKISDKFFVDEEVNRIALAAPEAKLNIIREYQVKEKRDVTVPDEFTGIVRCVNPKCITNNDEVKQKFRVISKKEVSLKCHYCEKITDQEHMVFI